MNLKKLGLEIIEEVATRNTKNEKEKNNLFNAWSSMYEGLTRGNEDRELKFYMLADEGYGMGSILMKLKKEVVKNRKLDTKYIATEIERLEKNNDIDSLINLVGETFLEYIDARELKYLNDRMKRQGWNWEAVLEEFNRKEQLCRAFGCLNRPYGKIGRSGAFEGNKKSLNMLVAI